ncbi:MAG: hypothetical protein DWQ01_00075 [Planctomycetota bacterium]|nr:MAG: hypothetical protein DWQ01_00075 [Planctomycetota bacterium]
MKYALLAALGCALGATLPLSAQQPTAAGQVLVKARTLLQNGKAEAAESLLADVVQKNPQAAQAWLLLGQSRHQQKKFDAALEANRKAFAFFSTRNLAAYNAACALSRLDRKQEAIAWLHQAVGAGFLRMEAMAQDSDLKNLNQEPGFQWFFQSHVYDADDFQTFVDGPGKLHKVFSGEAAGDQFGWEARTIGDVDGDGALDFVASAPYKALYGPACGRIYVYSGSSGRLLFQKDGEAYAQLGVCIAGAGDVNGDGTPDVVVGAPRGDGGPGTAWIYSGKDGEVLFELCQQEAGDRLGARVAGVGDVNGDGHSEVFIGAPGAAPQGQGKAYLYSGADGSLLHTFQGEKAGDSFGGTVAGIVQGERRLLAVGAKDAGANRGGVATVYRWHEGTWSPFFKVEPDANSVELAGMFLSFVGDINADGHADLYVSDWQDRTLGSTTGKIVVHSGKDGKRLLSLTGEQAGDGFGIGSAEAGDVNGDGHDDLVIGSWRFPNGATMGGKVYLYSGKDGKELAAWTCTMPQETFGFDATGIGDVDGDQIPDLLITGAYGFVNGPRAGRTYILSPGRLASDSATQGQEQP